MRCGHGPTPVSQRAPKAARLRWTGSPPVRTRCTCARRSAMRVESAWSSPRRSSATIGGDRDRPTPPGRAPRSRQHTAAKLPQRPATITGAGIQLVTVWQSKAQLDQAYGKDADNVLTNHRTKQAQVFWMRPRNPMPEDPMALSQREADHQHRDADALFAELVLSRPSYVHRFSADRRVESPRRCTRRVGELSAALAVVLVRDDRTGLGIDIADPRLRRRHQHRIGSAERHPARCPHRTVRLPFADAVDRLRLAATH